jgi:serine/threonine protein kinase
LRQVLAGLKDIWALNIIHRDVKLANILLNFPNNPELNNMDKNQKIAFLKKFDFTRGDDFKCVIADFGLSTFLLPGTQGQQSICGTPLYSAP